MNYKEILCLLLKWSSSLVPVLTTCASALIVSLTQVPNIKTYEDSLIIAYALTHVFVTYLGSLQFKIEAHIYECVWCQGVGVWWGGRWRVPRPQRALFGLSGFQLHVRPPGASYCRDPPLGLRTLTSTALVQWSTTLLDLFPGRRARSESPCRRFWYRVSLSNVFQCVRAQFKWQKLEL